MFKTIAGKFFHKLSCVFLLPHFQCKRRSRKLFAGNHLLGQSFRISHYRHRGLPFQPAQYFRTKNLIGRILLSVLNGPTVGRRKKQDICISVHLHHVMVKIPGFLQVIQDKHIDTRHRLDKSRGKQRSARPVHAFQKYIFYTLIPTQRSQTRYIGMFGIDVLKLFYTHRSINRCCKNNQSGSNMHTKRRRMEQEFTVQNLKLILPYGKQLLRQCTE